MPCHLNQRIADSYLQSDVMNYIIDKITPVYTIMIYIYKILYFLFADYTASGDLLMAVASSNFSELAF